MLGHLKLNLKFAETRKKSRKALPRPLLYASPVHAQRVDVKSLHKF